MPKAVLDSSVLVSAFLSPAGTPATLLAHARAGAFLLCLSPPILTETAGVLLRPKLRARRAYTPQEVLGFCNGLAACAEMVTDLPTLDVVVNDPKDNPILATAVAAQADYLVTGDRRHLLSLDPYEGIRIVSARHFLSELG